MENNTPAFLKYFGQFVSYILHPLFIPTYFMFCLGIALRLRLRELDDIGIGQGGHDQEEHKQDEQDVIQCIREHFRFAL